MIRVLLVIIKRNSCTHSDGEHPQGDHGGEVEGGNTGTDTDGQGVRVCVHVPGDVGHSLAHLQRGDAAAVLHNLCEEGNEIIINIFDTCQLGDMLMDDRLAVSQIHLSKTLR